jgi:hypothetical protein
MKKLVIALLAGLSLVAALGMGCSSAPKKEAEAPGQAAPAPAEKSSPVDLGAASSGRAI